MSLKENCDITNKNTAFSHKRGSSDEFQFKKFQNVLKLKDFKI